MSNQPTVLFVCVHNAGRSQIDRRFSALDSSPVSPIRSASSRVATLPAWVTTPVPSPDTDNPEDHEIRFTNRVPSSENFFNRRKSKNPY